MDKTTFMRKMRLTSDYPIYLYRNEEIYSLYGNTSYFAFDDYYFVGPYGVGKYTYYVDMSTKDELLVCWFIVDEDKCTFRYLDVRKNLAIRYAENITRFLFVQLKLKEINPKDFEIILPKGIPATPTMRRFGKVTIINYVAT